MDRGKRLAPIVFSKCAEAHCGMQNYIGFRVFLAVLGADGTQIEASFCQAIRTAREQKSISLAKCAQKKLRKILEPKDKSMDGERAPTTSLVTNPISASV
jgi:hypothetical protein